MEGNNRLHTCPLTSTQALLPHRYTACVPGNRLGAVKDEERTVTWTQKSWDWVNWTLDGEVSTPWKLGVFILHQQFSHFLML